MDADTLDYTGFGPSDQESAADFVRGRLTTSVSFVGRSVARRVASHRRAGALGACLVPCCSRRRCSACSAPSAWC
jgi:hypothetical protein